MFRLVLLAATAIGGVLVGRQAINRTIERRLPQEIEAATSAATVEINRTIDDVARERLSVFAISLVVKIALIGAFYLLFAFGHLTATGLHISGGVLLAGFIVRDVVKNASLVWTAFAHIRRHRWSIRRALTEFVAGAVFERAYREALEKTAAPQNKFWLGLSKYSVHGVSTEVAEAVAQVARSTSFRRIRSRAILGGATAAVMLAVYSSMIAAMLNAG